MMKSYKTLLFIASVIALLAGLSIVFPKDGVTLFGKELHFPGLSRVLAPDEGVNIDSIMAAQELRMEELNGLKDSVAAYKAWMDSSELRFWYPKGDDTFFDTFFETCDSNDSRTIRVLHYGDSQIEMDRLSSRLRVWMQQQFGGGGPGLQPIRTIIANYSVNESNQGALTLQTCFGGDSLSMMRRANGNYGPMVQCFHLNGSSSTNFSAPNNQYADERVKSYSTIGVVFNNRPGPLTATLSDKKGSYSQTYTCTEEGVHSFWWHLDSATSSIRLDLSGNADIYGVAIDNGRGVAVDNIPMRGCSGQQFSMINQDQLTAAYSLLDVGIIIMEFGGNSVPYLNSVKGIETYAGNIGRQIDRLHQCCPNAKILFVGPSDMSTTRNGELQSYPYLEQVISGLRDTALAHGAAYWSIYHAMGGHNSMLAWKAKGWAGEDHIHFSQKGSVIMGDRMAEAFDRIYTYYRMRKELEAKTVENENVE